MKAICGTCAWRDDEGERESARAHALAHRGHTVLLCTDDGDVIAAFFSPVNHHGEINV